MQPSILHRVATLAFVIVAVVVGLVRGAEAQGYRDIVGGPMTTKRFERLARVYVIPTDAEMSALDRLHEAYLERFRNEIDPEVKRIAESADEGVPTREQWERMLRDIERVGDRIAEADAALFAAAAEAVVESKRAGLARMKAARERQRLLGGMAKFAPMAFGGGTAFVDVADLLARPAYFAALTPEARAQLDALLATHDARLNAQARSYNTEARQAMSGYLDLSLQMMADAQSDLAGASTPAAAEGEAPVGEAPVGDAAAQQAAADAAAAKEMAQSQARMDRLQRSMAELSKPLRKIVRANHADNRGATAQLEAILGRPVAIELRETVALRSLGMSGYGYQGDEDLQAVAKRIKRGRDAEPELVARVDEALLAWRTGRAEALEGHLATLDRLDAAGFRLNQGYEEEPDPETAEGRLQLEYTAAFSGMYIRIQSLDEALREALVAALGARVDEYFSREQMEGGEGEGAKEVFLPKPEAMPTPDAAAPEAADPEVAGDGAPMRFSISELAPVSRAQVTQALRLAGVAADEAVVDALHEAWIADRWGPRVGPLVAAHAEASSKCYEFDDAGNLIYNRAEIDKVGAAAQSAYAAATEAESALVDDLAGALGFAADSAAALLIRLGEVDRLPSADMGGYGFQSPRSLNITRALALAKATPDEVRAILAAAPEEWKAGMTAIRPLVARGLALEQETLVAQARMDGGEGAQAFEAMRVAAEARSREIGELRGRLVKAFDASCAAAIPDGERRAAFERARLRAMHPELFLPADSAERQLDGALALAGVDGGIDEDLRARIEALRAEYLALFDQMTKGMAQAGSEAVIGEDADWSLYRAKMEEVERFRFDRRERTMRVLGELRRLLGPERVARVPGLAEAVDEPARAASPWGMDGGDED
jgi:hypothetical protein